MVEYLQRCGFDPPTWLLLFAVIMDIRPGYVDHRGCVPHTQALWSLNIFGGLGTVISTVCTCFLDRRPWRWIRFLWKYLIRQEGLPQLWRCLLCLGFFFHADITKEIKKQRHREFALCRCMLYTLYKNLTCYLLFCPVGVNGRRHTLPERS